MKELLAEYGNHAPSKEVAQQLVERLIAREILRREPNMKTWIAFNA